MKVLPRKAGRPALTFFSAVRIGVPVAAVQCIGLISANTAGATGIWVPLRAGWSLKREQCECTVVFHLYFWKGLQNMLLELTGEDGNEARVGCEFCPTWPRLGVFWPSGAQAVMYISVSFCQMIKAWTPASLGPRNSETLSPKLSP